MTTARVFGPKGETLATIHDVRQQGVPNQDLIAAAPDLLEALKSIENDCGCIPPAIWELRNQAIAKATGESVGNPTISPSAPGRSTPLAGGSVAPGAKSSTGREEAGR